MSYVNSKISLYKSVTDCTPSPRTITLGDFLDFHNWKDQVDFVRASSTKAERKERKLSLPAVTMSGVFAGRGADKLIQHSGLLCLDIDRQDNNHIPDFTQLKYQFANFQEVVYAGASVSGIDNGLFVVIPISRPDQHRQHFNAIRNDLEKVFNIVIDNSCSDVSRLRFVSYDMQPVFNFNAKAYTKTAPDRIQPQSASRQMTTYKPRIEGTGTTTERVETCVQMICNTHTDITGHYSDWMKIAFALNSEFGEAGRQYFHEVSQYHPEYDLEEADRKYNQCRQPGRITIASFFEVCKRYGITWKQNAVA